MTDPETIEEVRDQVKRLAIPGYGDDEVGFIVETLDLVQPEIILEWGTSYGASARVFHEATLILGIDSLIVTTELPIELAPMSPEHAGTNTGVIFDTIHMIFQRRGDGVTESLVHIKASGSPARAALFYVDGDHSEANVLRELRAIAKVAPDAAILMHDTKPGPRPHYGPSHALDTFLAECEYEHVYRETQAGISRLLP